MQFKILKKSKKSKARLGIIKTKNGILHTPAFFPVATQACLKTLDTEDINKIGFEGILCNTYHLMLRPGNSLIKKMGGLHKFINFKGIISTDSGGYQVFSLGTSIEHGVGKLINIFPGKKEIQKKPKSAGFTKITEQGVHFKSYLDGEKHFLTPEKSIKIQEDLGADIIFAFDECTSPLDTPEYTQKAMERTHRWAKRCLKAHKSEQALFGIIQGGWYKKLRQQSAQFIGSLPFDGFGVGGSLGKEKSTMFKVLDWSIPFLPEDKPRHLLGIGYLEDFEKCIKKGVDLFDCVYPTRIARHGIAITSKGKVNARKAEFLKSKAPLDKNCHCPVCQNYTRSYLCHLIRSNEITGMRLLTLHNLYFFKNYLEKIREKIKSGLI